MLRKSLLLLLTLATLPAMAQLTSRVNPIIGTNGMGHTFPGACVPFGIVQVSPDTDTIPHNIDGVYQRRAYEYCAGYQHRDSSIVGFSHTHFSGTGHSDLGDILLMPFTGKLQLNPGTADNPDSGYRQRFSHKTEISRPGYYEVKLSDANVKVRLTATEHAGIHQYVYPAGAQQKLIIDLNHSIYNYDGKVLWANLRVENDTLLTGYRITNGWSRVNYTYFAITFSRPIKHYGYADKKKINYNGFWKRFDVNHDFPEIGGRQIVTWFDFGSDVSNRPLEIKVALSAVSTHGARLNLEKETAGLTFDELVRKANDKWEKALGVIDAEGTDDQLAMFYTSLYHTMINPSVYMDADGNYRGIDHEIHHADGFTNYTIFSVWDTYRALHPLLTIINRRVGTDIVKSMMAHCSQSVHKMLPVWSHDGNENWCMVGYHGVSVVADAITKNFAIDKQAALQDMITTSNVDYYDHTADYKKYGFVPCDHSATSASVTLEYAYDDWTVYRTALALGDLKTANEYRTRAMSYQKVFNPATGFAQPRFADGKWRKPFDLLQTSDEGFVEGNGWNYSFYVPHDVNSLIRIMGGDKRFISRLDTLFTMHIPDEFFANTEDVTREGMLGGYVQGNEPSHHIPYLYAWTSQPWKSQYWIREIMNKMYRNNIDGLCGNDDCGQMSAWYIFSAMGFYPVCPGTDQYVFGAPYLPYMKINLENGRTFTIKAPKVSDKNRYIRSIRLNGKLYTKSYITQNDIMNGGELFFDMVSSPVKNRQFTEAEKPYSLSTDSTQTLRRTGSAHQFRFIHNNDGSDLLLNRWFNDRPLTLADLDSSVDLIANTQVTTYMMCSGSDFVYYPSNYGRLLGDDKNGTLDCKSNPTLYKQLKTMYDNESFLQSKGTDIIRYTLSRARQKGLESFITYRVNDLHFNNHNEDCPLMFSDFWNAHPEYWVNDTTQGFNSAGALDFAHPEVRQQKLNMIYEQLDKYADCLDGYELDFLRFFVYFKPGEGHKYTKEMTQFVSDVRKKIDEISTRTGHQILLAVRVAPKLSENMEKGLDVREWLRHDLVDFVTIGTHWRIDPALPVDHFRTELGDDLNVPLYATLADGGYKPFETLSEGMNTGAASHILANGADGVYLFNYYFGPPNFQNNNPKPLPGGEVIRVRTPKALQYLGRMETLRYRNKTYFLPDGSPQYGMFPVTPLPLQVKKNASGNIFVGDEVRTDVPENVFLYFRTDKSGKFSVAVNGRTVGQEIQGFAKTYDKEHNMEGTDMNYAYEVPVSALRQGYNQVSFSNSGNDPFTVKRIELSLKYGPVETNGYF